MPSDLFQVEQAKFKMEFAFMNVKQGSKAMKPIQVYFKSKWSLLFQFGASEAHQAHRFLRACDEVRRFKISAAHQTSEQKTVPLDSNDGLIQGISDNFDTNLSTQNELKQTHSLATIIVQHRDHPHTERRDPIPRLLKS